LARDAAATGAFIDEAVDRYLAARAGATH